MAKKLQLRRGTTAQHNNFTGAVGECTVDTDKDTLVVHDGNQAGGRPLLREDLNNLADDAIGFAKLADIGTDHRLLGRDNSTDGTVAEVQVATDMVADDAVTYAKLQNVAANTMLGNNTNSAANAIELDAAAVRTFLGVATGANNYTHPDHGTGGGGDATSNADGDITIRDDAVTYAKMQDLGTANRVLGGTSAGEIGEVQVGTDMIANDAVTYAKLQNVTANRILGNNTASDAAAVELTKAQMLTFLNVADGAEVNVNPTVSYNVVNGSGTITMSPGSDTAVIDNVTNAVNGLMLATDKAKLDNIASNANNYSHPNHTGHVTSTGDGVTAINASNAANGRKLQLNVAGDGTQTLEWVTLSVPAASVPAGAHMLFWDASAPDGWTIDGNQGDHALRVVGSNGGGTGGATNFSSVFQSGLSTGAHTLAESEMPAHIHSVPHVNANTNGPTNACGRNCATLYQNGDTTGNSNSTGGGGSHSHTLNMDVKFCNVIICEKN